jgi:hypothetical protein
VASGAKAGFGFFYKHCTDQLIAPASSGCFDKSRAGRGRKKKQQQRQHPLAFTITRAARLAWPDAFNRWARSFAFLPSSPRRPSVPATRNHSQNTANVDRYRASEHDMHEARRSQQQRQTEQNTSSSSISIGLVSSRCCCLLQYVHAHVYQHLAAAAGDETVAAQERA